jgi:polar amino acid transport system substrate-binding protein
MKQLVQNLKSGEMKLIDAPIPALSSKNVLVRVHHSLISAGTEGSKVSTARKGYIGKAKEKPEQVKQVLDTLKKEGLSNTYRKVMNKLDSWSPLGYSCAGQVIEAGSEISTLKIGDLVACAGADIANHAQVVSVPLNLCSKLPQRVKTEQAAYTTVGAIALQGIRQADLRLGESCAVIGLGLIGQLTVQMLAASGVQVFGIDVNPQTLNITKESGAAAAFLREDAGLVQSIHESTSGYGVDAVIITAGVNSLDPVELAGQLARKKGRIIIVGAVPTGFSRDNYYKKELDLRMSCSYGPGRYDPDYEEKGIDYPYSYVRWTENRNMQAFLDLIAAGRIFPQNLTTHTFAFEKGTDAFDLIMKKEESYLGVLLEYETQKAVKKINIISYNPKQEKVNIGFIGAGSFAQTFLLPNIHKEKDVALIGVVNNQGHTAQTAAERYGFAFAATDTSAIYEDDKINTIFIATRHNLHASQVIESLKQGKNVFVEKPLALNLEELEEIKDLYNKIYNSEFPIPTFRQQANPPFGVANFPLLMVGFNRRFAPQVVKIKKIFEQGPVAVNYRINAGSIPKEHWSQDLDIGGGRIIGEVCHFVDLAMFLSGSLPTSVQAFSIPDASSLNDTLVCNLQFKNGSVATISYFSNGSKAVPKEYLEVYGNGVTAILKDFKELSIFERKEKKEKLFNQDKGHKNEVKAFLQAIKKGNTSPIPFEEIYISSLLPFKIIESIQKSIVIEL